MSIMLMRAIKRELGQWAMDPASKIFGVVLMFLFLTAVVWLMQKFIEVGSVVAVWELLKSWLSSKTTQSSNGLWPHNLKLLDLNGRDSFTLGDALLGVCILGATGSGKTSGPFRYVIRAFLRVMMGGLFLCVKQDAPETYRKWAKDEGREDDVINFGIGLPHSFNFLQYLSANRAGRLMVGDVVHVLMAVLDTLSRNTTREDRFFREAAKELFSYIALVLYLAYERIELDALAKMLSSLPRDANFAKSTTSFCGETLEKAWNRARGTDLEAEMKSVIQFFHVDWPNYAVETRESIRATSQVLINELMREPLLSLFGKTTTVTPDDVLAGKLLIVDIPIHAHQRIGEIAATIWKTSVQRATLARREKIDMADPSKVRPVFIAGDEAHELVSRGDETFASSSRELVGITVYATQTINNLIKEIERPPTITLLSNLRNRFICRTDDPETAQWVRDSIGQSLNGGFEFGPESWAAADKNAFTTELLRELKQGGGKDLRVEAIVSKGGAEFKATKKRWYKATFRQKLPPAKEQKNSWFQRLTSNDVIISAKKPKKDSPNEPSKDTSVN